MSRLAIPDRNVPEASKPIFDAVKKQIGVVPNMFRLIASSPAALQGFVANNGALTKALDVKTRERIALAVAQVNRCDYCLVGAQLSWPEPGEDHPRGGGSQSQGRIRRCESGCRRAFRNQGRA